MSRHRFYAPPTSIEPDSITLDAQETHHLQHVLRLRVGMSVNVFDGVGNEYVCQLESISRSQARLSIVQQLRPRVESPVALTLAQGLAKGDKFDVVIQKATELGVHRIVPLVTSHTASTGLQSVNPARLDRWRRVALEATKQCGRTQLTDITPPVALGQFLTESSQPTLLFSEHGGRSLSDIRAMWCDTVPSIRLLIGPEGGWQTSEIALAQSAGAIPVSLGSRILRTETAAIVTVSLVQHLWGDLK